MLKCKNVSSNSDPTPTILRRNSDACLTEKKFVPLPTLKYVRQLVDSLAPLEDRMSSN